MFEEPKVGRLIEPETIRERVAELGRQITRDYAGRPLMLVGVLKGAFIFMSDLARAIDLPLTCDFLRVSSYGDAKKSTGVVRFELDTTQPVTGKDVILVEDIVDSGLTVDYLLQNLSTRKPASLRVCAFLHKKEKTIRPLTIDYLGFEIKNHFVVGYGLDFAGEYRNLPYVGVIRDS